MDETTFRILDILARDLGLQTSIRALAGKIRSKYGSGHYANVYNKLRQLAQENIVEILNVGKASLVGLNFKEYVVADLMAEIEIKKKQELLKGRPELGMLFLGLDAHLRDLVFVRSISIINAEKNLKLNRAELLAVVRGRGASLFPDGNEAKLLHTALQTLQSAHSLKLDYLIVTDQKLLDSLATDEANPVREMMPNRITFYGPQNFWNTIRVGADAGLTLRVQESETLPARIPEADLALNLARAGYKETGTTLATSGGMDICVEYVVAAMMAQGDARRVEAVPVILAKQAGRVNYDILLFLAQKYRLLEMLLGLLRAYTEILHDERAKDVVELMDQMKIKEVPADKTAIREKMKLYNALR